MSKNIFVCIVEVLEWMVLSFVFVFSFIEVSVYVWYFDFDWLYFVVDVVCVDLVQLIGIDCVCDMLLVNIL